MIPSTTGFLDKDFEITQQPTYTHLMQLDNKVIRGHTDGQEAMRQAIFKILQTERYQYVIYSWNYGIETLDLYGQPVAWVCPELERRITEALTCDDRITSVSDFDFDTSKKGVVHCTFTAHTIFGDVQAEREVNF